MLNHEGDHFQELERRRSTRKLIALHRDWTRSTRVKYRKFDIPFCSWHEKKIIWHIFPRGTSDDLLTAIRLRIKLPISIHLPFVVQAHLTDDIYAAEAEG